MIPTFPHVLGEQSKRGSGLKRGIPRDGKGEKEKMGEKEKGKRKKVGCDHPEKMEKRVGVGFLALWGFLLPG